MTTEVHKKTEIIETVIQQPDTSHEIQKELEDLRTENAKLSNRLAGTSEELEVILKENEELKGWKEKTMYELEEKNKEVRSLYKKIDELEAIINLLGNAKKDYKVLAGEVHRITRIARDREEDTVKLNKIIKDLLNEKCMKPNEHEEFNLQLDKIDGLTAELNEFKQKFESLNKDYEEQVEVIKDRENEIDVLKHSIEKREKESKKALDGELSKEEKLEKEIEKLTKKVEEGQFEIERLKSLPNEQIEELITDIYKMNDLVNAREKTLSEMEKERPIYTNEIEQLKKSVESLQEAIKVKEEEIKKAKEEPAKLTVQLNEYKESLKILEQDRNSFIAERDKLASGLQIIHEPSNTLHEKVEKLTLTLEIIESKNVLLESEIAALKSQLFAEKKGKKNLVKDSDEVENLKSKLSNLNSFFDEVVRDKDWLLAENTELKRQINELAGVKFDFAQAQQKVEYLAIERDKLIETLEERGVELKNLSAVISDYEALKRRFQKSEREIELLKTEVEAKGAYVKEFDATAAKANELEIKIADASDQKEKLIQENSELRRKCLELQASVLVINEKYCKVYEVYNKIKNVAENISRVQEKLNVAYERTEEARSTEVSEKVAVVFDEQEVYQPLSQRF